MNYAPTVTYHPIFEILARVFSIAGAFGLVLIIGVVIASMFGAFSGRAIISKKLSSILGYIAMGATVAVAMVGMLMTNSSEYQSIQSQRDANLVSNLKAKYLVTDVDFNMDDYKTFFKNDKVISLYSSGSQEQTIIVSLRDNEKAVFLLTQNADTSEPTLTDLPFSKASVADLTRK